MAINLLNLEPHKVSRDLSGYITYLYGQPKVGKTTLCSQFPGALLLATEKGYNAIPGIYAQDITTWGELKQVVRELKKPEVHEKFQTVIIDTVDIAGSLCDKYICNQLGVENLGDGGWTNNGWAKYKKEFEEVMRNIVQLNYALVLISHDADKTFKRKDGSEYNQIVPTAQKSINDIVKGMADIYAYATLLPTGQRKLILRSEDGSVDVGCRFKYITPMIDLSYEALREALNKAIDKEAEETDNQYVTDESIKTPIAQEYDYDALMDEFKTLAGQLMEKGSATNGPKITQIIDKYLGKGKKINETTRDQAEFVYLIVDEIKNTLM